MFLLSASKLLNNLNYPFERLEIQFMNTPTYLFKSNFLCVDLHWFQVFLEDRAFQFIEPFLCYMFFKIVIQVIFAKSIYSDIN